MKAHADDDFGLLPIIHVRPVQAAVTSSAAVARVAAMPSLAAWTRQVSVGGAFAMVATLTLGRLFGIAAA